MEQVALCAPVHHEEKHWLALTDCSNAINTVIWTAVTRGGGRLRVGTYTFRPQMRRRDTCTRVLPDGLGSGESRNMDCCSGGVQQTETMGPALLSCIPLLPVLKRTREDFEPRGAEVFASLYDTIIKSDRSHS